MAGYEKVEEKAIDVVNHNRLVYLSMRMVSQQEREDNEKKKSGATLWNKILLRGKTKQQCSHVDLVMKVGCQGPNHCYWRVTDEEERKRRKDAESSGFFLQDYTRPEDHDRHFHFLCISVVTAGFVWQLDRTWLPDKDIPEQGVTKKYFKVYQVQTTEEQYQKLLSYCKASRSRNPGYDWDSLDAAMYANTGLLCKPQDESWSASPLSCLSHTFCGCIWVSANALCKCVQGIRRSWCCGETRMRAWWRTREFRNLDYAQPEQLVDAMPEKEFCPSFVIHAFAFAGLHHLDELPPLTATPDNISDRFVAISAEPVKWKVTQVDFRNVRKPAITHVFHPVFNQFVVPFDCTGVNDKIGNKSA